jgi:predicted ATPase
MLVTPVPYRAFSELPAWMMRALEMLFAEYERDQPLSDEELRFKAGLSSEQFSILRTKLQLITTGRPTALGILQLPQAHRVVEVLERIVDLNRALYRPRAAAVEGPELLAALGVADEAELNRVLSFARDLHLVDPPPWRLVLTEERAQYVSLEQVFRREYCARYDGGGHARRMRSSRGAAIPTRLLRLRATGFRTLASFDLPLGPGAVVLVGANGAGKSTVLDAIAFMAHALELGLPAAVQNQGGMERLRTRGTTGPVTLELAFEMTLANQPRNGHYLFTFDSLADGVVVDSERLEVADTSGGTQVLIDGHRSVALLHGHNGVPVEKFHAADELVLTSIDENRQLPLATELRLALSDVVLVDRDPLTLADSSIWQAGGASSTGRARRRTSLATLLGMVAADDSLTQQLAAHMRTFVPRVADVRRVVVEEEGRVGAQLEVIESDVPGATAVADLSAGTRQLLVLAALHVLPDPPRVILLEEPEGGLHVGALHALRDLLRSLALRSTVVATSHSPAFVGLLDAEREVYALAREADGTKAVTLAAALRSSKWLSAFGSPAEAFARAGSERRR